MEVERSVLVDGCRNRIHVSHASGGVCMSKLEMLCYLALVYAWWLSVEDSQ